MPDLKSNLQALPALFTDRGLTVDHRPSYQGYNLSSCELRAGRTGPTVIALPRLQTALKNGGKTRPRLLKLNYRSLPVGPQRGKDDRREYVRGGVLHGG